MKKQEQSLKKETLKGALTILSALLCGAVAVLFAVYGLTYKSLAFIAQHFDLLVWLTCGVICLLLIAFIVFNLWDKQTFYRSVLFALICIDIFAIIFYAICASGLITKINSIDGLRDYISQFGSLAALLFILFQFLQVVVLPVPGSVSIAAGVALFGPFWCMVYSFIGIILGSFVAFFIGRFAGYKVACWIVGKDDLNKWLDKIKGKDYLILTLMFLLPLFPDDVLCFVAGLSSMSTLYFTVMIIITRAISVSTTAYSLELIPFNTWWGILIWVLILLAVVAAFYFVYKYSDKIDAFIKRKFVHSKKQTKRKNKNKV
jgi:uncharacterized membrane protein YdjX (TVP38/TMEM64 family)